MKRTLVSSLTYLGVGLAAIVVAFFVATQFLAESKSQETNPGIPAAPVPPPPSPVPEGAAPTLPSTESQGEGAPAQSDVLPVPPSEGEPSPTPETVESQEPELATPEAAEPKTRVTIDQGPAQTDLDEEKIMKNLAAEVQSLLEPFIYDPKGRRDPFRVFVEARMVEDGNLQGPLLPLQRFDLDQLKLIGIIWDVSEPKAMFLDPNKEVHVVGKDERIGRKNGYLATIREGEVVVVEATQLRGEVVYSTKIIRIVR